MNLALLSNHETQEGTRSIEHLLESLNLVGSSGSFIASQPDIEGYFFSQCQAFYQSIGIELETYIDFESGYSNDLMAEVLSKPVIHLSGGNTYRFLNSLKARDIAKKLVDYAQTGSLMIGVSAGAMLLTPSIESAELCGDKNFVGLDNFSSLGLVNFMFAAHATKLNSELVIAQRIVDEYKIPMYLCNNSEGIVIINNQVQLFGNPILLEPVNPIP